MILRNSQADLSVSFEPPILIHEHDVWRFERVLIRQQNLTVVNSFMKLCVLGSLNGEVPGVDVIGEGLRSEVGQFFLCEFAGLSHDALFADIGRPHSENNITHHHQQL